ncbi:gliding motility-associated ABC transporter permease subunit GldF [Marinilongibacter aquaticus]|uniref:gliding motility-associated ABC transporter permease subunit GldF n=1 Tax=Marinilongibacter aquaticus TaxID=2975157 RepID=UPI0021BD0881|nr:gliding motility-associated ABC transporter permease subunit GldF [Marinilongibacter aquaticus]UBM59822.1 gliding motility-associated ABC transporter permease subunit GldF [Marinilongibacter aquaticus]
MFIIFKKEFNAYLHSLVAYLVIVLFLVLTGLVLWVFPESNVLDYGYAEMGSFFQLTPFILLMLVPAITMRSFSEEFKTGTIEFLLTKPLTSFQLIWGKFSAAWLLVFLAILPTLTYYFSISSLGNPVGNIDTAAVFGSYFGLLLLAAVFTALGLWASSLTANQIVAFLLSAFLCYFLFDGLHQIASLFKGKTQFYIDYLSLQFHYTELSRGVIDSRNVIYLLSFTVLVILLTKSSIERRKK